MHSSIWNSSASVKVVKILLFSIFGSTICTDSADPDRLLAHSQFTSTWPEKFNPETGLFESYWPGWWADEYYGDNAAELASQIGDKIFSLYDTYREVN